MNNYMQAIENSKMDFLLLASQNKQQEENQLINILLSFQRNDSMLGKARIVKEA